MKISDKIDFINNQNPKSRFDFINIEDIRLRQTRQHSSYHFHILKFYTLFFVIEGSGKHYIDFNTYNCTKGTVLFIGDGQVHRFSKSSNLKGYLLAFHDDFFSFLNINTTTQILQLFNNILVEPKLQLTPNNFQDCLNKITRIKEEYFNINDSFSNQIIGAELYSLFSSLLRLSISKHDINLKSKHLNKFIDFQNLLVKNIFNTSKVKFYSESLGMTGKTLNTIIKSISKKQAKEYINDYYLLRIKRVLMNKQLSIKECAFQVGFDDLSNFHNFFKHHLNTTPEQFRKKYS